MREYLDALFEADGPFLSLMHSGLRDLTDAEYWWEPVPGCWSVRRRSEAAAPLDDVWGDETWGLEILYPEPEPSPFTTIAWRMAHMTGSTLLAASALRGRRQPSGHLDSTWPELRALPASGAAAVERWNAAMEIVTSLLADASEDDLRRLESHSWEPAPMPVWRQVEFFAYFEPASHAAEVRLLRDLHRHTAANAFQAPART